MVINKGLLSFYYTFIGLVGKENMDNTFTLIFFIDKKSLLHYVIISLVFEL